MEKSKGNRFRLILRATSQLHSRTGVRPPAGILKQGMSELKGLEDGKPRQRWRVSSPTDPNRSQDRLDGGQSGLDRKRQFARVERPASRRVRQKCATRASVPCPKRKSKRPADCGPPFDENL